MIWCGFKPEMSQENIIHNDTLYNIIAADKDAQLGKRKSSDSWLTDEDIE